MKVTPDDGWIPLLKDDVIDFDEPTWVIVECRNNISKQVLTQKLSYYSHNFRYNPIRYRIIDVTPFEDENSTGTENI